MNTLFDYDQKILNLFRRIKFEEQGAVGESPREWAKEMGIASCYELTDAPMNRSEVRKICQKSKVDPLYGYLYAMAWGAQGRGPKGAKPVRDAWRSREKVKVAINRLRSGSLSRSEAYDLFTGKGKIPGLGPAYFTKLLFFFSVEQDNYIMDQWTTKSIILLTGRNIIRHTDAGPANNNTGENYELFCRVIDDLKEILGEESGERVEQRLFSIGSVRRGPRGKWRQFVYDTWPNRPKLPRYNKKQIQQILEQTKA
jgi:hypothetical protein